MFNISNILNNLPLYLLRIPVILIAITVHESAHGFMAYKLGDPTAKAMGRISLNPLRHFDIVGTICMILIGFGWAKPVMMNPDNFKNKKLGEILVALAGPFSNLILGFIGAILYYVYFCFIIPLISSAGLAKAIRMFLEIFLTLNVSLAVFNMIPIPPLDGSHIITVFLPGKVQYFFAKYNQIIVIVFIVLLWTGILSLPISKASTAICNGMLTLIDNIFMFFGAV